MTRHNDNLIIFRVGQKGPLVEFFGETKDKKFVEVHHDEIDKEWVMPVSLLVPVSKSAHDWMDARAK